MPAYATDGSAGMDCYALAGGELQPPKWRNRFVVETDRIRVPLGFAIQIPEGYEGQIRPRSGLGLKHGLHVAGGTIDSDYTGEVSALLFNLGGEPFTWAAGDRVCQFVVAPVLRAELVAVEELAASDRGGNGWGSSGR